MGKYYFLIFSIIDVTSSCIEPLKNCSQKNETMSKGGMKENSNDDIVEIHYGVVVGADENEPLIHVVSSEAGPNDFKN